MLILVRNLVRFSTLLLFAVLLVNINSVYATPVSPVNSQTSDFRRIDQYVLATPRSYEKSLDRLTAYLIKPANNDVAKARAIYRWITANISYDTEAFFSGRYRNKKVTAEEVYRSRHGVCDAYATLFNAMALRAGLEAKKVSGISKGINYSRSQVTNNVENHAWNAVKLNGHWHLLDTTWGAGIVDSNTRKFVRKFSEFYFLSQPQQFIYSHFPLDASWQLLKSPISFSEFDNLVLIKPEFFSNGLQLYSHKQAEISVDSYAEVVLGIPSNIDVIAKVSFHGQELEKYYYYWEREGDKTIIKTLFPKPGLYTLDIYAKTPNETSQYPQVLEYRINAAKGSNQRFPVFQKAFFDYHLKLNSHTQGVVYANGELKMTLKVPEKVFLIARLTQGENKLSRNLVFLQRENGLYQIRSLFPKAGEYELQFFTKTKVDAAAISTLTYKIIANKGVDVQAEYPEYFLKFEEHHGQLYFPIKSQLKSGVKEFFKIKVPEAQQVVVKVSEQWYFLEKQGSVFSGHIPIEKGVVKILAKFPGDTNEYSSLLRYSGI